MRPTLIHPCIGRRAGQFYIWLCIFLLTGCSPAVPAPATPTTAPIPVTNTATLTVPVTSTASPLPAISTATLRVTVSPTESPIPVNITEPATSEAAPATIEIVSASQYLKDVLASPCIPLKDGPPAELHLPGMLLGLRDIIPYAVDPNSGAVTGQLVSNPIRDGLIQQDYTLSPNGKWLTYVASYGDVNELIVEPASNILTNSSKGRITWKPNQTFQLVGWLNNNEIALTLLKDKEKFLFPPTLIRNPFTGEQHKFALENMPNFLNYYPDMNGAYLLSTSTLMPDPTLTRMVYLTSLDDGIKGALFDLQNKKILTNFSIERDPLGGNNAPLWSPNGSDFVIMGLTKDVNYTEWFQITKDGDIRQLTNFGDTGLNHGYSYWNTSRSWDGRYLAFEMTYDKSKSDGKYLIMNLTSQTPQGFCIGPISMRESQNLLHPVWSPDGKYVVIADVSDATDLLANTFGRWILVDVEKREAYQLSQDIHLYAIGWMAVDDPLPVSTPTP